MKTALTELLEDLNSMKNSEVLGIAKDAINECIITATSYLETEKQQIIEAATHGANFDKSPYSSAHEYYDKTYTTNKETLK